MNLADIFEDVIASSKPIDLNKKYYNSYLKDKWGSSFQKLKWYDDDSFYLECYDKDGKDIGKVRVGLQITPGALAEANPVGSGRTEPN